MRRRRPGRESIAPPRGGPHAPLRTAAPPVRLRRIGGRSPRVRCAERAVSRIDHIAKQARWLRWMSITCPALKDLPDLTTLDCLSCKQPWPCPAAQEQLEALSTSQRGAYLALVLAAAPARRHAELYRHYLLELRRDRD